MRLPVSGRAAVASQLEAGRAAIAAGAVQAGIDCLRRACADAAACADPALQGQALAALGGALVHAVRGRDEEGAAVLHEAVRLATRAGDRPTAVTAHHAAATPAGSPVRLPVSGRAAVASQLEAGRAAIAAGAVQAGIDCLRRACADAEACAA